MALCIYIISWNRIFYKDHGGSRRMMTGNKSFSHFFFTYLLYSCTMKTSMKIYEANEAAEELRISWRKFIRRANGYVDNDKITRIEYGAYINRSIPSHPNHHILVRPSPGHPNILLSSRPILPSRILCHILPSHRNICMVVRNI